MKCPKCKTDGAYQPLLRQLECPNHSCSFYADAARDDATKKYLDGMGFLKFPNYPIVPTKECEKIDNCPIGELEWKKRREDLFAKRVYDEKYRVTKQPGPIDFPKFVSVNKDLLKNIHITKMNSHTNRPTKTSEVRFIIDGYFHNRDEMDKAIKLMNELFKK